MVELFRRSVALMFAGVVGLAGAANAQPAPSPGPSGDPPARVGRLAFVQGTVSFHDNDQTDWAPAVVNTPLTSGDALWTEPNARSEVSIAGTRVRLDSGTQLDMLAIDDTQTRMQLDQGRIDIKTFTYDTHQPYEILTPRGTITLQQQGDYYVEAGSTQDPTRLGVRSGAAQIQAPNGQVLAVRAGEMGEVADDNGSPQLRTIPQAPPPMPTYWAERDRTVVYDQPPQYVTANMTGYEDLNGYGSWSNDPDYGQVWTPRAVVAGWEPYRTGHWAFVEPWGWTWVDDQPWGFAPYHYGRWANRNNRWVWVPPQRDLRPVYAPALVAFVGGVELGVAIGQQSRAPVGWFPLGPREVYVPPYSNDRDYYRRINQSARVQDQVMEDRWQRAQRHEAIAANQQQTAFMNRRFATVVPAEDFARSRPVARAALQVAPDRLAAAPVAPVAAPPAPTQSIRAVQAPGTAPNAAPTGRPNDPNARAPNAQAPTAAAPGAKAPAAQTAAQANVPVAQTRLANMQAIGRPEPTAADRPKAPGPQIATTRPNEPNAPNAARPGLPPLAPRTGAAPPQPGQPAPSNAPKPADNKAVTAPPPAGQPGQQPHPPAQVNRPVEPPKPGEPPKPQQAQQPAPPTPAAPPKPQGAVTPPAPQPQATPPKPQPQQAQQPVAPPQPPHQPQAEPPKPQGAVTPPPQPQRQAAPQPQPQAPPPAQAHAPAPPPQPQHQAAPPPPAQAHAPAPAPQPQPQAHPAPQQAQAPAPAPQQHAAPPPPPKPAAPAPAPPKKDDEKK